jgi:hypothetical protein
MQYNNLSQNQRQETFTVSRSAGATNVKQEGIDFSPSSDEVARRAYFSYLNEGSQPGHDVQHWLSAESQLIEERKLTRSHGFHNRT